VVVPLAEELAFRGYLMRRLISTGFRERPPDRFTWASFLISSALFGTLHGRWLAGILYALALYRRRNLADPPWPTPSPTPCSRFTSWPAGPCHCGREASAPVGSRGLDPHCPSDRLAGVVNVKKRTRVRSLPLAVAGLLLAAGGADWPGFRGPGGLGVAEDRGMPVRWGPAENLLWKKELPGPGSSSPIVSGGKVFVTCYSGYGTGPGGDMDRLRRHLLCLEGKTGDLLWQKDVTPRLPETRYGGFIREHGYASSTPATDGERVFVFFGRTGVLAFDFEGRQLWQTPLGNALNGWGSAASPLLYGDLVLVNASVESNSLLALDKRSGKEVWRVKGVSDSWSTPVLVPVPGGGHEVVINTPGVVLGFHPGTGEKLWECAGIEGSMATSTPVARDGVVYVMGSGTEGRATLAIRAGGRGDVAKTHLLWKQKAAGGVCSPVLYGDHLYWVNGGAWCLRADTGRIVFQERLYEARQEYSSPVAADGKLFVFTRRNGAFVLGAAGKFERLAHNDLGDGSPFNSSPAVSDGRLLVRSDKYLYCIGTPR
jgi:outer membrane protein assembly factor BamB